MMEGRELRRSYTQMEFSTGRMVRPQYHQVRGGLPGKQQRYPGLQQVHHPARSKFPTQEIYRPPSQRDGENKSGKLNVHAKEFAPLQATAPLQNSKSTGSILSAVHNESIRNKNSNKSVAFPGSKMFVHQDTSHQVSEEERRPELQRSKSTTSAMPASPPSVDMDMFGSSKSALLHRLLAKPKEVKSPELLELSELVVGKAQENRLSAESLAALSLYIIESERHTTFLESLLNMCQYTVKKRRKTSRNNNSNSNYYYAFMAFLHALYCELKPRRMQFTFCGSSPTVTILTLLAEVCTDLLRQQPLNSRKEIECFFFVVTTVGRDLESETPGGMSRLMGAVRDAFMAKTTSSPIKKTLLQLVELRAARWQLNARVINYYQSSLLASSPPPSLGT